MRRDEQSFCWAPSQNHRQLMMNRLKCCPQNLAAVYLLERGFPDVEHFSSEREDAITVPADHSQPGHSKCLGWISLSKDQCAADGVLPTCQRTWLLQDDQVLFLSRMLSKGKKKRKKKCLMSITCIIGIVQFWHPLDLCVFNSWTFLVELGLSLELHPVHDAFHNPTGCGLWRAENEGISRMMEHFWGWRAQAGCS